MTHTGAVAATFADKKDFVFAGQGLEHRGREFFRELIGAGNGTATMPTRLLLARFVGGRREARLRSTAVASVPVSCLAFGGGSGDEILGMQNGAATWRNQFLCTV